MGAVFNTVQDLVQNYIEATYEKDVEKFVSAYASDIHIYDCWGNWESTGISQWRAKVNEWFQGLREEGVTLKTEFHDVVIEQDSQLAYLRCAVVFAAYDGAGEKLRQITNRFTFGLRKENGSWAIKHEHSSLPISMETGKGMFDLK